MTFDTGTPGVPAAAADIAAGGATLVKDAATDWVQYLLSLARLPEQVAASTETLAVAVAVGLAGVGIGWLAQRWTWANSTVEDIGRYIDPEYRGDGSLGIAADPDVEL